MKRFFDLVFSLVVLLLVWPLLALLALVVFLDDGGPVIYRQDRVGKDGKLFKIRKFRTMKHGTRAAAKSDLSEFEDCVTKTGRFLRRTSLDELPQILNILDGSMSVIGPRPFWRGIPWRVAGASCRSGFYPRFSLRCPLRCSG